MTDFTQYNQQYFKILHFEKHLCVLFAVYVSFVKMQSLQL